MCLTNIQSVVGEVNVTIIFAFKRLTLNVYRNNILASRWQRLQSKHQRSIYLSPRPPIMSRQVFSGIQCTGKLHLGNYIGSIATWLQYQKQPSKKLPIYSIVDQHAYTSRPSSISLSDGILEMATSLLACGLDPQKCILFQQSKVFYPNIPSHPHSRSTNTHSSCGFWAVTVPWPIYHSWRLLK